MKAKRFFSVAAFAAALFAAVSCGDRGVTGVSAQPHPDALLFFGMTSPKLGLVTCTPQPYDSVTQVVGPEGGTIHVGGFTLLIPDSALDSAVTITAVAPSDTINDVRFQPAGLHFNQKASLTIGYANCGIVGWLLPQHIAYTDDSLNIIDFIPSVPNVLTQTVTGSIRHFSEYALAW
ncbi:MAG TPA: hypothetical protein VI139_10115 [Gemmatimonadales bacterium]